MGKIKQPKDKINFNLIPDFALAKFKEKSVRFSAEALVPKLTQTGDLKYLERLACHQPLYMEEVFWRQVRQWKIDAFFAEIRGEKALTEQIKKIQKAITKGFSKSIKPPTQPPGRPGKSFEINIDEYLNIQKMLASKGITDCDIKRLAQYRKALESPSTGKINPNWARDEIPKIIDSRTRLINKFFQQRGIELSENEIQELVEKRNFIIARPFIAKSQNTSGITVSRMLAQKDPRYADVLIFKLPDGKEKKILLNRFLKEVQKIKRKYLKSNLPLDNSQYNEQLSKRLHVPIETLEQKHYYLDFAKLRTPHETKTPPKKSAKNK